MSLRPVPYLKPPPSTPPIPKETALTLSKHTLPLMHWTPSHSPSSGFGSAAYILSLFTLKSFFFPMASNLRVLLASSK